MAKSPEGPRSSPPPPPSSPPPAPEEQPTNGAMKAAFTKAAEKKNKGKESKNAETALQTPDDSITPEEVIQALSGGVDEGREQPNQTRRTRQKPIETKPAEADVSSKLAFTKDQPLSAEGLEEQRKEMLAAHVAKMSASRAAGRKDADRNLRRQGVTIRNIKGPPRGPRAPERATESTANAIPLSSEEVAGLQAAGRAGEQSPNSPEEYREKLGALFDKYGKNMNTALDQTEDYRPTYARRQELKAFVDNARRVREEGAGRIRDAVAGVDSAPETQPVPVATASQEGGAIAPVGFAAAEAARAYQTGALDTAPAAVNAPEAAPFDPNRFDPREAAAIYQAGPDAGKAFREAHEQTIEREAKAGRKLENNAAYRLEHESAKAEEKHREEVYFSALRASQKRRGFWGATAERMGLRRGKDDDPMGQIAALRSGWVESRAATAKLGLDSIDARRAGRGGEARQGRDIEKVRERYQRMVVMRDAVFGAEEKEQKTRKEGLAMRDKHLIEKVWKGWDKLSPKQRILISGTFITGAGIVGAMAGVVPAVALAGAGAVGARLNWVGQNRRERAQKKREAGDIAGAERDEKVAGRYGTAGNWFTLGGLGGMFARVPTRGVTSGQRKRAENSLSKKEHADLRDSTAFEELSEERGKAAREKDRIDSLVTTAGATGSVLASTLGAAYIGSHLAHHNAPPTHHTTPGAHNPGGHETGPAAPHQPAHHGVETRIDTRGEGADHLFRAFKTDIVKEYGPDPSHYPPVVQELLKFKTMDDFSHAVGFEHLAGAGHPGTSALMYEAVKGAHAHPASTFSLSADGKVFNFIDAKGVVHPVMQEMGPTPQIPHPHAVTIEQHVPMHTTGHHDAPRAHTGGPAAREVPPATASQSGGDAAPSAQPPQTPDAPPPVVPRTVPLEDVPDNSST